MSAASGPSSGIGLLSEAKRATIPMKIIQNATTYATILMIPDMSEAL
jgi:hypothetical protein